MAVSVLRTTWQQQRRQQPTNHLTIQPLALILQVAASIDTLALFETYSPVPIPLCSFCNAYLVQLACEISLFHSFSIPSNACWLVAHLNLFKYPVLALLGRIA